MVKIARKSWSLWLVCRSGGFKPLCSKASRCELFPNQLPREGMETIQVAVVVLQPVGFPNQLPREGMETLGAEQGYYY